MKRWTGKEINTLRFSYGCMPVSKLAMRIGRTEIAIKNKARKLGLNPKLSWRERLPMKAVRALRIRGWPARKISQMIAPRSEGSQYNLGKRSG